MTVHVVRAQSEADAAGAAWSEWTVTVARFRTERVIFEGAPPRAADLPADIRAGLRAWLDEAEA